MKKSIALFLALMMILSLMPVLSVAEDAPVVTVVQVDANLTQQLSNPESKVVHDAIKEAINVDVQMLLFPQDTFNTRVSMTLATDEDMDIICRTSISQAIEWYNDEAIIPISDVLDKLPNMVAYTEKSEALANARREASFNGIELGIPMISAGKHNNDALMIRSDWLEKFGMSMPTTLEEYEAYLEAVVTKDPDGNGVNDTYGLCGNTSSGNILTVFANFYLPAGNNWWLDENGVLQHPATHPNYKKLLAKVVEWQDKGYLAPNALLSGNDQRVDWIANNRLGSIAGYYTAHNAALINLQKNLPEAYYQPTVLTIEPDAANALCNMLAYTSLICINANTKNLDAACRYLDYMFTPDGYDTLWYGVEGTTYDIVDGIPYFRTDESGAILYRTAYMPQFLSDVGRYGLYPNNAPTYILMNKTREYLNALPGYDTADKLVTYDWTGTDSEFVKGDLDTFISENRAKVLAGEIPVDQWDAVIAEWRSIGGDQLTADRNTLYQAAIAK